MTAVSLKCGQVQNRVPRVHNSLPPGWKKIAAHLPRGSEYFIFYISPDGRRFNTLEQIKQYFSQIESGHTRKRRHTGEGNPPKRPRLSDEVETPSESDVESVAKNNQVLSTEEVSKRKKQLTKRFKREGLLTGTLRKNAWTKLWMEEQQQQQQLMWNQQLWAQEQANTTTI